MTVRVLTILFFGTLFWLAFNFLFYAGLFVNYIEAHTIPIFYNEFFADSQYWWLWPIGIFIYGTLFILEDRTREKSAVFIATLLVASIPWVPTLGERIGKALFADGKMVYRFGKITIDDATLLYSGRGYDYVQIPGRQMTLRYPVARRVEKRDE
ncbi:hypothetical protein [Hydrogenimonas sp.]